MMKEISRITGLISEDRRPPPVFSPCIKAGNLAGLFFAIHLIQVTYLKLHIWGRFGLTPWLNKGRIAVLEVSTG